MLPQAKEEYEKQQRLDGAQISTEQRAKIMGLASVFPRLWNEPKTLDRDRKRMARLLVEDVTLRREQEVLVQIRFKGGAIRELPLPLPKSGWALRKTKAEIIAEIERLLEENTEAQIAHCLNERGWCSSTGCPFNLRIVNQLRRAHKLKDRRQRLREQGWLTVRETADLLKCPCGNVNHWRKAVLLKATKFCNTNDRLYERPTQTVIAQIQSRRRCEHGKITNSPTHQSGVV